MATIVQVSSVPIIIQSDKALGVWCAIDYRRGPVPPRWRLQMDWRFKYCKYFPSSFRAIHDIYFPPCDVRCRVYASGSSTCSRPARLVRHTTCPPINKSRTMFLTNRVSSCPHVWPFVHLSARRSNSATIASSANRYSGRIW